jgi:saccharopine dehydrogenase (NAD+, L-lysine-forming)
MDLLLYGAYGYTGELLTHEAVRRGLRPILAGRRADALAELANRFGLETRAFSLDDPETVRRKIHDVPLVLHAAGPFFRTSKPMADACVAVGAHYLDITGEISVFEALRGRHEEARRAGVVLLPGVGFDVVPSDCLAASLAEELPLATRLELAFGGGAGMSRGTAKTMASGLGHGGAIRENGRIRTVPAAWRTKTIPFRDKPRRAVTIPWGDVSTANWSTGIPNICVYMALPPARIRALRLSRFLAPLLRLAAVQRRIERRIDAGAAGPPAELRETRMTQLWGRVEMNDGRSLERTLETPDGYQLTAIAGIECARRILEAPPAPGYHTPSTAFGWRFVTELPGCTLA